MLARLLPTALILSWNLCLCSTLQAHQGLVGALGSLAAGLALLVLLLGEAQRDAAALGEDETRLAEQLAFSFPIH